MEYTWEPIDKIFINESINQIHIDTRDFCALIREDVVNVKDGENKVIKNAIYHPEFIIDESEIIPWVKNLETISNGKSDWRCLTFNNVNDGNWLKYIRIYKLKNKWIVCNRDNEPIVWKNCNEENLKKHLLMNDD